MKPLLLVGLLGCAPAVRLAGRCPTAPNYAVDFAAATAGLAASAYAYNERAEGTAAASAIGGMLVAVAANLSECR